MTPSTQMFKSNFAPLLPQSDSALGFFSEVENDFPLVCQCHVCFGAASCWLFVGVLGITAGMNQKYEIYEMPLNASFHLIISLYCIRNVKD